MVPGTCPRAPCIPDPCTGLFPVDALRARVLDGPALDALLFDINNV